MKFIVHGNNALIHRLLKIVETGSVKYQTAGDGESIAMFEIDDEKVLKWVVETENIKAMEEIPW